MSPPAAGCEPTALTKESGWDGVQLFISQALEDPELASQAISTLEKERPDGEVLLSCSAQELQQGLGLSFTLAKKLRNRVEQYCSQALATSASSPLKRPPSQGTGTHPHGSASATITKAGATSHGGAAPFTFPDVTLERDQAQGSHQDHLDVAPGLGAAEGSAPGDDAGNPTPPTDGSGPSSPNAKRGRGRPRKQQPASAEPGRPSSPDAQRGRGRPRKQPPAVHIKPEPGTSPTEAMPAAATLAGAGAADAEGTQAGMDEDMGMQAEPALHPVKKEAVEASPVQIPVPPPGMVANHRRSRRTAAVYARALLANVARAETANVDDFAAAAELDTLKQHPRGSTDGSAEERSDDLQDRSDDQDAVMDDEHADGEHEGRHAKGRGSKRGASAAPAGRRGRKQARPTRSPQEDEEQGQGDAAADMDVEEQGAAGAAAVKREPVLEPQEPRARQEAPMEVEDLTLTTDDGDVGGPDDEGNDDGKDSDYAPSEVMEVKREPRLTRGRSSGGQAANNGCRRATGAAVEEVELLLSSDDDEVDVEVEEMADDEDALLLPRPDNQALPHYDMVYLQEVAINGFKLMLAGMDLPELQQVVRVIGEDADEWSWYMGKKRNKETGEVTQVRRKRTLAQWRKLLYTYFVDQQKLFKHSSTVQMLLETMAADVDCQEYLRRYLDNCYRVYPQLDHDGGNLPAVILDMWKEVHQEPPPESCLLGTRTIHIMLMRDKGFRKEGLVKHLYKQFAGSDPMDLPEERQEQSVRFNEKKHKTDAARADVMQWLREACRAARSSNVYIAYKSYLEKQEYHVKVRVYLKSKEVMAGALDAQDEPAAQTSRVQALLEQADNCDLLALYQGLDHVRGVELHAKRLLQAEQLQNLYNKVVSELGEREMQEEGHGPEGELNLTQMEELLEYCEGNEYEEPANLKRVLKHLRLKLMPYQKQALCAIMQEEQNNQAAKNMWLELPLPQQEKYEPEVIAQLLKDNAEEAAERAALRRARGRGGKPESEDEEDDEEDEEMDFGGDHDEDERPEHSEEEDQDEEALLESLHSEAARKQQAELMRHVKAEQDTRRNTRHQAELNGGRDKAEQRRQEKARQAQLQGSAVVDQGFLLPHLEERAEDAKPGIRPLVRLFYSPALNAFYWGTNLKEMQRGSKLGLPLQRGIMCCLEVGMGKTAVALAAACQSRRTYFTHAGRPVELGEWSDELLYDGMDGYQGHLHRGGTLVVAPKTLLPQWESIEIKKFLGVEYQQEKVLNSSGVQGKKRPMVPKDLTRYSMVLVNAELMVNNQNMPMYQGVMWERIIVDEAHQEDGLMDKLAAIPKRSLIMLTGTPLTQEASDLKKMLSALRMPPFNTLARSAFRMGHVLTHTMIRYTNAGTALTGQANLVLPPKSEREVLVGWGGEREKYQVLESFCQTKVENYLAEVGDAQRYRDAHPGQKRQLKALEKKIGYTVNHMRLMEALRPLRHASSGGVKVEFSLPREQQALLQRIKAEPGTQAAMDEEEDQYEQDPDSELVKVKTYFTTKIRALISEVKKLQRTSPETKVVIFSCFSDTLEAIQRAMEPEGFQFRSMTASMSMKMRARALDDFLNDPPTTIFLLSAAVASVGLTLVSASHLFLMEPAMNPAQELQAVGRIHRMGQTRPVTITRLVMKDSVEARIRELLVKRDQNQRKQFAKPACTKAKGGRKNRNSGEDVSGVCASANTEELITLFGGQVHQLLHKAAEQDEDEGEEEQEQEEEGEDMDQE